MGTYDRLIDAFKDDLLLFGRTIAPWDFEIESPDFHRDIADACLDHSIQKLVVQAPRGFAKSTLIRTYGLWHIFMSDLAYKRKRTPKVVAVQSKSKEAVLKEMRKIKRVLNTSGELKEIFGDHSQSVCDALGYGRWAESHLILPGRHEYIMKGGRQQTRTYRTTLAIGDDMEDETNTKTDFALEQNYRAFVAGYVNTLDHIHGDKVMIIGTPIVPGCLVEVFMEQAARNAAKGYKRVRHGSGREVRAGWHGMHFSGIVRDDPDDPLEGGESLWPELKPMAAMLHDKEEAEEMGKLSTWYSEVMCQIIQDADLFFEQYGYYAGRIEIDGLRHWLVITHQGEQAKTRRHRKDSYRELKEETRIPVNVFMGLDPASSQDPRAARSVAMPVAIDPDKNLYVLPYWAGRKRPLEVGEHTHQVWQRYKPIRLTVESVAYQTMMLQYLTREKQIPGVIDGGKPIGEKDERLGNTLQPWFGKGKVWIVPNEMGLLESELEIFPALYTRDALDALFYAQLNCYPPQRAAEKPRKRRLFRRTSWMSVP